MDQEQQVVHTTAGVDYLLSHFNMEEYDLVVTPLSHVCPNQAYIDLVHSGQHPTMQHYYYSDDALFNRFQQLDDGSEHFPCYRECVACHTMF